MPFTQLALTVTIVRHAETEIDLMRPKIISGQKSVPLTDAGKVQAKALAARLARIKYSEVYTSDAQQATETLEEIIRFQDDSKVILDPRLRECNLGKITGMTYSDVISFANECPMSLDEFIDQDGESMEIFQERVHNFYVQIVKDSIINHNQNSPKQMNQAENPKHILVISHGGWIDCLMRYLINDLNFDLEIRQNDRFAYKSSIYQFKIQKIVSDILDDYEWQGVIDMMNDASHLATVSKEFSRLLSNGKMPRDSPIEAPFTVRKEILGMLGVYSPFQPKYQEKSSPLASLMDLPAVKYDIVQTDPTTVQRLRTLGW